MIKTIPEEMKNHPYKYNIINRLILLKGGVRNLNEKKRELTNYLQSNGARPSTVRKWLAIERGVKHEIPASALIEIRNFLNKKYRAEFDHEIRMGNLHPTAIFKPLELSALYCEGQRKIIPER